MAAWLAARTAFLLAILAACSGRPARRHYRGCLLRASEPPCAARKGCVKLPEDVGVSQRRPSEQNWPWQCSPEQSWPLGCAGRAQNSEVRAASAPAPADGQGAPASQLNLGGRWRSALRRTAVQPCSLPSLAAQGQDYIKTVYNINDHSCAAHSATVGVCTDAHRMSSKFAACTASEREAVASASTVTRG